MDSLKQAQGQAHQTRTRKTPIQHAFKRDYTPTTDNKLIARYAVVFMFPLLRIAHICKLLPRTLFSFKCGIKILKNGINKPFYTFKDLFLKIFKCGAFLKNL